MTENREVCWLAFLRTLKKSKAKQGSDLEEFRIAVLHDVDFCWAAVEENSSAAHNALRYIAWRMWPNSSEVPDLVTAVLAAGQVEPDW
jgi:hypothetical protein